MHEKVENVLRLAHQFAWREQHEYVTVEHLLLMWCCSRCQCEEEAERFMLEEVQRFVRTNNVRLQEFEGCSATLGLKRVLERCGRLSLSLPKERDEWLLPLAMCMERNSYAAYVLHKYGVAALLKNEGLDIAGC